LRVEPHDDASLIASLSSGTDQRPTNRSYDQTTPRGATSYGSIVNDDPPAIVGVCIPKVSRSLPDDTPIQLTLAAARGAMADAGITKDEFDGACLQWDGPGGLPQYGSIKWARLFGHHFSWVIEGGQDSWGLRGVLNVAAAIQAGMSDPAVRELTTLGTIGWLSLHGVITDKRNLIQTQFDAD
jgi:hypothetical protein